MHRTLPLVLWLTACPTRNSDLPPPQMPPDPCAEEGSCPDAGAPDVGRPDVPRVPVDVAFDRPGAFDAGRPDASPIDARTIDARTIDAAPIDAPSIDAPDVARVDVPIDLPPCPSGQARCPTTPFLNEPASSFRCRPLVVGACPAPDLIVGRDWVLDEGAGNRLHLTVETFAADAPELTEGCIMAPGTRRLLRFNFAAFNVGNENLNVGRPDERDTIHWEFFGPHGHFHVRGWGDLRLRRLDGTVISRGRKLSFCLEDNVRINDRAGPRQFAPPLCAMFSPTMPFEERPEFGLSVGWGDIYPQDVRCQFLDLGPNQTTARDYTADGFYDLALGINLGDRTPVPLYRESNYSNNTEVLRVEVRAPNAYVCESNAGAACAGGRVQCDGRCAP